MPDEALPAGAPQAATASKPALPAGAPQAEATSKPALTPAGDPVPEELIAKIEAEHEEQTVLISFPDGASAAQIEEALAKSGCTVPQRITSDDLALGFATLTVADGYDVEHAMAQLDLVPELGDAQPNFIYHLADDQGGPSGSSSSGATDLKSSLPALSIAGSAEPQGASLLAQAVSVNDPYTSQQWALASINAYEAWGIVKTDKRVTVAILDNGCLINHEDLKDNVVASYNVVTGKEGDVDPAYGTHGTHVAGIVAAQADNGRGVAGVSYNARILPIQVFRSSDTATSSAIVSAYNYIEKNASKYNIRVVNMSLGGTYNGSSIASVSIGTTDRQLINAVNSAYDKGILTVCSAGNDASKLVDGKERGAYLNFPSDWLDNALGVINLQNGIIPTRNASSNYNMAGQKTKDIAAPGSSIYSTYSTGTSLYGYQTGTSMASPCVAGVAALVFAANPDLSAKDVAGILCQTATDLGSAGWDSEYGWGEVDAKAAVQQAGSFIEGGENVLVGGTVQLAPSTEGDWSWSSSDPSIADVSQTGVVTGLKGGTVIITARTSKVSLTKALTVYDISFAGNHAVLAGATLPLAFNKNAAAEGTWRFDSANDAIAKPYATSDGVAVLGIAPGSTTITATLEADETITATYDVIVEQLDLSSDALAVEWPDLNGFTYSGAACEPVPTKVSYTFANGETQEVPQSSYALSYENNVNAGQAAAVLTGIDPAINTYTRTFTIRPATIADATVEELERELATGKPVTPEPVVSLNGKTLKAGTDYTLSYANNVLPGTATVLIEGTGNFTGRTQVEFQICSKSLEDGTMRLAESSYTYDGTAHKPAVTVTYEGGLLREGSDYTLAYQDNVNAGTGVALVKGIGPYAGSLRATFAIQKRAVPLPVAVAGLTYTGSAQVGVRAGSGYALSGNTATAAGSYTATAALSNVRNYIWADGTSTAKRVAFRIAQASLASATVSGLASSYAYTGAAIAPAPTVKVGGRTLVRNTDYTLTFSNNVNVGTATITITGKGGYTGTKKVTFGITTTSIAKASVSGLPSWSYYTGSLQKPGFTVKLGTRTLASGRDYTVAYAGNKNVGTATVTITGKGVYTGTLTKTFKIIAKPSYAGATSMPVSSTAVWSISNCSLRIISGGACISLSGRTVTAKKAGTAVVGVYNAAGALVAQRTVKVYALTGTVHTLKSAVNTSFALDVKGASKKNSANVQLYRANGTAAQKWRFALLSDGTYRLLSYRSGKALDVKGGSKKNGANVQQYTWNSSDAQRWRITVDASNRLTLICKKSGRALDLSGARAANGRNIQQYVSNGTLAQKWVLGT